MAAAPESKDPVEEIERVVRNRLTDSEVSCLMTAFSSQAILIMNGKMKDRDISSLHIKIQRMVKTTTKSQLISDYIFDGLVPMSFGQRNTVLQYVIRGSDLYCAKIGDASTIEAEILSSQLVHEKQQCPSVMPVIDSITIDKNRVAMVCPLYPMPVSHTMVNAATILNVALCGLATIKAFSNKQLCHGDIKPSNMMFQAANRTVVTIDFGSCTAYGNMLAATSPGFGMDCGTEASLRYDLTCLAASIILLSGFTLTEIQTREEARLKLAPLSGLHFSVAMFCLDDSIVAVDEIWTKCKVLVEVGLPTADWVVDCDSIWPMIEND
jgi:serine/threonine protein kinase